MNRRRFEPRVDLLEPRKLLDGAGDDPPADFVGPPLPGSIAPPGPDATDPTEEDIAFSVPGDLPPPSSIGGFPVSSIVVAPLPELGSAPPGGILSDGPATVVIPPPVVDPALLPPPVDSASPDAVPPPDEAPLADGAGS